MYRRFTVLAATSLLLLFSAAASSAYVIGDESALSVTLSVNDIDHVDVAFIGDDQFIPASDSGNYSAITVPDSEDLVLLASSARPKEQLKLSYNENVDIATNAEDKCYVFYRTIGDRAYKIAFSNAEGLSIDKEGVRPIEFSVSAGDASYNTADSASEGSISISGTSVGIIPVNVVTETIDGSVGNRPAGLYSGSLTLSVLAD